VFYKSKYREKLTMNINKKNKKMIMFIILIVAITILTTGLTGCKEEVDTSANATLIKCNAGKTLDDDDLKAIEDACKTRIGDKFIKVEKREGMIPVLGLPTNEAGEELISSVGDGLTVTCRLLIDDEPADIITDISKRLNFIHDYGMEFENAVYQIEIKDVYRADLK
jgi:hypothetical protein